MPDADLLKVRWDDADGAHQQECAAAQAVSFGRSPDNVFRLSDSSVSWIHAQFSFGEDGMRITDLGSTNGTYVDGARLAPNIPIDLTENQSIRLGNVELSWSVGVGAKEPDPADFELLIGRSASCDIVIIDPTVSTRHALLSYHSDRCSVRDLGSTNGTFVNGAQIQYRELKPTDQLRIGGHLLNFNTQIPKAPLPNGVRLYASHLSLSGFASGRALTLLRDVSLTINPRELVAIIGASGAGKTTLLLALAGQQPATQGSVLFNEIDLYANPDLCRSSIGFVPQSDIVHLELTVEAALTYSGRLRLPSDTSGSELRKLVHDVLHELGLWERRNDRIRTLSGGERKRINIGVELLTKPSVLFLDEPTSGLDAALERRIVALLRQLAGDGRTIIAVSHSVQTIQDFDKIAVMSRGGRLAFFGTPKDALKFFDARDFVDLYEKANDPAWAALFLEEEKPSDSILLAKAVPKKRNQAPQFWTLVRRYLEILWSDPKNLLVLGLQAPVVAIFVCVLYSSNLFSSQQEADRTGHFPIQDAPAMLFLLAFSVTCFGLFNSVKEIVKERAIYDRERFVFLRRGPYLMSKAVVIGAVAVFQCLVIVAIVGSIIGFGAGLSGLVPVLSLLVLGMLAAVSLGLWISAFANNSDQAIALSAGFLLAEVALSGLIPLERMGGFLASLSYLSGMRWTYGGLCAVTELEKRWSDIGLGEQVPQVFTTLLPTAMMVLITVAICSLAGSWLLMAKRDAGKGPFRR